MIKSSTPYADLILDQGTDFKSSIDIHDSRGFPLDISDCTFKGQIRRTYTSEKAYDFEIIKSEDNIGKIYAKLSASITKNMRAGNYVYDINMVNSSGKITRVIKGQIEVMPRVSK